VSACPKVPGCGREHAGCVAHNYSGAPCGGIPMRGTEPKHCRKHVGVKTEIIKAQWDARQEGERIRATYDLPAQSDPLTELLRISREIVTWKDVCRVMIGDLAGMDGAAEQVRIRFYESSLDRAARVLSDVVRLGVEDRLARVEERQTNLSIAAVEAALVELAPLLGYDPDRPEIHAVISKHLLAIQREEDPAHG